MIRRIRLTVGLLLLGTIIVFSQSQCTLTPLVNNDFNLPSYNRASSASMETDTTGRIFVGSIDVQYNGTPVVHMHDGTSWQKLGNIPVTGCNASRMAVSKSGVPYVAFRDQSSGSKLTVMKYTSNVWTNVGSPGISPGSVSAFDIIIDNSDLPVVTYKDQSTSGTSVMRFNGSAWNYVGPQFVTMFATNFLSLAIDSLNLPYVAYSDGGTWPGLNTTVKRFDGTNWVLVGPQYFSASQADYIDLKFDKNYNLYIAYSDYFYGQQVTVKRFTGTNWVNVGSPGFTSGVSNYVSLAIDSAGVPYVSCEMLLMTSNPSVSRVTVLKFNGTTWGTVGPTWNASEKDGTWTTLLIQKNNLPALAYTDENRNWKMGLKKYNGSTWNFVGDRGFSVGVSKDYSHMAALDNAGNYYACFSDSLNGYKASVMKYNNGTWAYVGSPGFSPGTADHMYIAFDSLNTPYVAFSDGANGSKHSVMKYTGSAWSYVGSPGFTSAQSAASCLIFKNNTPYIVVTGTVTNFRSLYAFNGSNWGPYSTSLNSYFNGGVFEPKIAFDSAGNLYMLSRGSSYVDVAKYNGSTWQSIATNSLGSGIYADMYVENNGKIYVAFTNASNQKLTAKKWDGSSWTLMGPAGFSSGNASVNSILHNKGTTYIAYSDAATQRKINFLRYNGNSWVPATTNSLVSAGVADFPKLANDTAGNIYLLYKATESYAKKIQISTMLTITSSSISCPGVPVNMLASGAGSYTWSTGATTNTIVVTPTASTNYYVSTTDQNGCIVSAYKAITTASTPIISVAGTGTICQGTSNLLTATGANTYTWSSGAASQTLVVTPSVTTIYTVSGTATTGCIGTGTFQANVQGAPNLVVSPMTTTICNNMPLTYTVSGAATYSVNNWSVPSPTFNVNTWLDTVFVITGVSALGCTAAVNSTVHVFPQSPFALTTSAATICTGQVVTFTASGASTYTWNNNPANSNATFSDSPTSSTNYTIAMTDSYGCGVIWTTYIQVTPCTGFTNEKSQQLFFGTAPNPSDGNFRLTVPDEAEVVTVFNSVGELVAFDIIGKEVKLTHAQHGLYFVKLRYHSEIYIMKHIVE